MVARSLGSFIVIMTLMAWVTHPWQVFALRVVQGFFAGYGPIAMMLAAESAPREEMATAIGWVQTAQRLGPALGPVIGGALAHAFGLRGAFYVSAVFYLLAFLLVLVGFTEPVRDPAREAELEATPRSWAYFRAMPTFVTAIVVVFCLQVVDRSFGPILPLYLTEVGADPSRVPFLTGIIFTLAAGAAAIGNQSTAWWLTRARAASLVLFATAVSAAAAIVFGLGPSVWVMGLTAVVLGGALGTGTTAIYTAMGHRVSAAERASAFGYLQMAYLIGLAVSPVVAGFIGAWSMRAVFFADAIGLAGLAWYVRGRMHTMDTPA
jgi:MFS family permease